MKTSSRLVPQDDLQRLRTACIKEKIEKSLGERDAQPVVIGVCQMRNHCGGGQGKKKNLEHMRKAAKAAKCHEVQILVFPELCLPGFFCKEHGSGQEAKAINRRLADEVGKSPFLQQIQELARNAGMVLSFGFSERAGSRIFNSIGVVDADGGWLGVRRKNPLGPSPYDSECFDQPGPSRRSVVFKSRHGKLGISNCFDGEFPESVRRMRLDGAEILLWSNAATGDARLGHSSRFNQSGSYAQTNFMWVACANAVSESKYGCSSIYSPWGEPLVQLSVAQEEIGFARINLALTKNWSRWKDRLAF